MRRWMGRGTVSTLVFLQATACGGAPSTGPSASPAKKSAAPPAVAAAVAAEGLPDVSPVSEPQGLIFYGRVSKPAALFRTAGVHLKNLLPGVVDAGPELVTNLVTGESLGPVVNTEEPVDVAASVPGPGSGASPMFAVSAAIGSLDEAKARLQKAAVTLAPMGGGWLRLDNLGPPVLEGEPGAWAHRTCALGPAAGAASTRIVCAWGGEGAVRSLGPWLVRTAPRNTVATDVHGELRFGVVHAWLQEFRGVIPAVLANLKGDPKLGGPAVTALFSATLHELADFVTDMDRFDLDFTFQDKEASVSVDAVIKGTSAAWSRSIVAPTASTAHGPPPEFFHLPNSVASVSFTSGGLEEKSLSRVRHLVGDAIAEVVELEGLPIEDARLVGSSLGFLFAPGPSVSASGWVAANEKKPKAPKKDDASTDDGWVRWSVMGSRVSFEEMSGVIKKLVVLTEKPVFKKLVKTNGKALLREARLRPIPKAAGLPTEALHVEASVALPNRAEGDLAEVLATVFEGAGLKPGQTLKLHLVAVPDGQESWLAYGTDEAVLLEAARKAHSSTKTPAPETLAQRPGLEDFQVPGLRSGGFLTLFDVVQGMGGKGRPPEARKSLVASVQALPSQGMTAIPWAVVAEPDKDGRGGRLTAKLRVPGQVVGEGVRIALKSLAGM